MKVLIDEVNLQKRIKEMADEIERDYKGKEIIIICILKGSIFFTVDLAKNIHNPIKIEFMKISSYGDATQSSGNIEISLDVKSSNIEGKDILIVEDIIDTGRTLKYLVEYLQKKKPSSIKLCTLLDKPNRREFQVDVDYVGFEIPDKFVVGYGLDNKEYDRNLPYIAYIET